MLLSRAVRPPAVVKEIGVSPLLTMEVGKFAHALGEGDSSTLLL